MPPTLLIFPGIMSSPPEKKVSDKIIARFFDFCKYSPKKFPKICQKTKSRSRPLQKKKVALDHGRKSQSRATSLHSYYLTSFCNPLFLLSTFAVALRSLQSILLWWKRPPTLCKFLLPPRWISGGIILPWNHIVKHFFKLLWRLSWGSLCSKIYVKLPLILPGADAKYISHKKPRTEIGITDCVDLSLFFDRVSDCLTFSLTVISSRIPKAYIAIGLYLLVLLHLYCSILFSLLQLTNCKKWTIIFCTKHRF